MADINWGILGTGGIAKAVTNDLLSNGFSVTAVGSRTRESAEQFAADHGITTAHASYEDLFADDTVDVVYISTPHPFHAEWAIAALKAGKHVLVEKSFAMNAVEAQEMVDTASERGLVVLEAMWTRWLPHMVRLRELLAEGTIGEVRTVIVDHNQKLPSDPKHRINDPDLGGGALLDLGIYPISFAWDILGEPSKVLATSSPTPTGVDRQTSVILGYPEGQSAVIHTALDTLGPNTAAVLGTEGWVEIASTWYQPTSFLVYNSENVVIEGFDAEVNSRGGQYQAWELERLVRAGKTAGTVLSPTESVGIMKTMDEIRVQIGLHYPSDR